MINALEHIVSIIDNICPVGSESVSNDTSFPYATYTYSLRETNQRADMELVVEIWDKDSLVLPIEQLAESIKTELNDKIFSLDSNFVRVYFDNQVSVPDPSNDIKRRRQTYLIYNYIKEA